MHRLLPLCVLFTTGCTHWSTETVYGPRYEVERKLLGSPAIEQTSSSDMHGGFSTDHVGETDRYRHHTVSGSSTVGSFGGETSHESMTHCVQQAEVHYKQPTQIVGAPSGRGLDLAAGIGSIAIGGMVMMISDVQSQSAIPRDTPGFSNPPSATPGLAIGGAIAIAGVALLAYSFGVLPKGPPPQVESRLDDVVETEWVEATGCGLPGDPTAAR